MPLKKKPGVLAEKPEIHMNYRLRLQGVSIGEQKWSLTTLKFVKISTSMGYYGKM